MGYAFRSLNASRLGKAGEQTQRLLKGFLFKSLIRNHDPLLAIIIITVIIFSIFWRHCHSDVTDVILTSLVEVWWLKTLLLNCRWIQNMDSAEDTRVIICPSGELSGRFQTDPIFILIHSLSEQLIWLLSLASSWSGYFSSSLVVGKFESF